MHAQLSLDILLSMLLALVVAGMMLAAYSHSDAASRGSQSEIAHYANESGYFVSVITHGCRCV